MRLDIIAHICEIARRIAISPRHLPVAEVNACSTRRRHDPIEQNAIIEIFRRCRHLPP
jgi:hypothetical protein